MEMISNFNFIHLRFNYTKPKGGSLFSVSVVLNMEILNDLRYHDNGCPYAIKRKLAPPLPEPLYTIYFFWGGGVVYCVLLLLHNKY